MNRRERSSYGAILDVGTAKTVAADGGYQRRRLPMVVRIGGDEPHAAWAATVDRDKKEEPASRQSRLGRSPSLLVRSDVGARPLGGVPGLFFARQAKSEQASPERRAAGENAPFGEQVLQLVDPRIRPLGEKSADAIMKNPQRWGALRPTRFQRAVIALVLHALDDAAHADRKTICHGVTRGACFDSGRKPTTKIHRER